MTSLPKPGRVHVPALFVSALLSLFSAPASAQNYPYTVGVTTDRTLLTPAEPIATITIWAGVFGYPVENQGPCNFIGDVYVNVGSGAGMLSPAASNNAVAPFGNGTSEEVVTNGAQVLSITGIDVFRGIDGVTPPPPDPGPPPHGANELVPVYRFQFTASSFSGQSVTISANGAGCRIFAWIYLDGAGWVPFPSARLPAGFAVVNLEIAGGPSINQHPTAVSTFLGEPASFQVVASGSPPLFYQWRRDGAAIVNGGRISGADTPILIINPTEAADAAIYDVIVTNFISSVTGNPATLSFTDSFIPTVFVGDAYNPPDTTGFGRVTYAYEIGQFEVTNAEYAACLNAVARADPNNMYNTLMATLPSGGIFRSGAPGSYTYIPRPGFYHRPVTLTSFYDAARFCNWLHNGRPSGPQDASTTEAGAFTLLGPTTLGAGTVDGRARNQGWLWAIANEDEWYKAAYGSTCGTYTLYPTRSNTLPVAAVPPGPPNAANYGNVVGNLTIRGAYATSPSFWNTFDQGGNVSESIEGSPTLGLYMRVRGGYFGSEGDSMAANVRGIAGNGTAEGGGVGFRVVKAVAIPQRGGCCFASGGCVEDVTAEECLELGGTYGGDGATCCSLRCFIPRGACCLGDGRCVPFTTFSECAGLHGQYQGDHSNCPDGMCQPVCGADWSGDGVINTQDFFSFLNDYFNAAPRADFNHDGVINTQDFFDYLTAFFANC